MITLGAVCVLLLTPGICTRNTPIEVQNTPYNLSDSPGISIPPRTITPAMRAEDPRLSQLVTLRSSNIYLGDFLERVARQTNTIILASDDDEGAGQILVVDVKDVRLGDVLDALRSLVSYRGADWTWERVATDAKPFTYRLHRTRASRALAARLRNEAQRDFESQTAKFLAGLEMSPEQLAAAGKTDRDLANLVADGSRHSLGLQAFKDIISQENQASVLRGQQSPVVRADTLPESGKNFVAFIIKQSAEINSSNPAFSAKANPEYVKFYVDNSGLAPTLFIGVDGYGAYGYAGGLPLYKDELNKLTDGWHIDGDSADDPLSLREASEPVSPVRSNSGNHGITLRRVRYLNSQKPPVSILARLPASNPRTVHMTVRQGQVKPVKTVRDLISRWQDEGINSKWRDGILLLTDMRLFSDVSTSTYLPWSVVRELRSSAGTNEKKALPISAYVRALAALPGPIPETLVEEFPGFRSIEEYRDVFAKMARLAEFHADICSAAGVKLQLVPFTETQESRIITFSQGTSPAAIRLVQKDGIDEDGNAALFCAFEALSRAGKVVAALPFALPGRIDPPDPFVSGADIP